MKYVRADSIFPREFLDEMKKYIPDGLVYIPKSKESRIRWGESSGEKQRLENRNREIRDAFRKSQKSIESIAIEYSLTIETVKNIVYGK